jgi:type II secretory pathway pseudopilin PulG
MAIAGLALGYTGIAVLPILIIAAIAIPNFLRAKIAANEASAVGSLRTIGIACFTYARNYNSYPPSLASLGPGTQPGPGAANLIDTPLSLGQRHGYVFTYDGKANASGTVTTYALYADPITEGQTGVRHFYLDQTGVFRVSVSGRATEDSPPLM